MTYSRHTHAERTEADDRELPLATRLPPSARELAAYLHDRLEAEGEYYAKSKFIAEEIDLSAKQIGAYLCQLENSDTDVTVKQWGKSNSTTWRVRPE